MKKMMFLLAALGVFSFTGGCRSTEMSSVPNGFIQSAEQAMEVGKIYLNRVYGADKVTEQEPFEVVLEDDLWIINGKINPYGGSMRIIMRRSSGQVISVSPVIDYSKPRRR